MDTLDIIWNLDQHKAAFVNEPKLLNLLTNTNYKLPDSIDYTVAFGMPVIDLFAANKKHFDNSNIVDIFALWILLR